MAVEGLNEILRRVKEENIIEGLGQRELDNPEGTGLDLRLKSIHRVTGGVAFLGADGVTPDKYGIRTGVDTELVAECDPNLDPTEQKVVSLLSGEYYLVQTMETLHMPQDLMADVYRRGTLIRAGVFLNCSKTDPGYEGPLTMGVVNLSPGEFKIQLGARFCNLVFHKINGQSVTYRGQQGQRL